MILLLIWHWAVAEPTITSPEVWGPLGAFFIFGVYMLRNIYERQSKDLAEERAWNRELVKDLQDKVFPAITTNTEATREYTQVMGRSIKVTEESMKLLGEYRTELLLERRMGKS